MFGLFGGKPPTSPKLVPGGFPALPEERKRPKMGTLDKIGILGGMISDTFGGTGNAQRMSSLAQDKVAQLAFEQEQERKLALVRQAMGAAGPGGGQPMDARTAALWQLNPDAMSKAASEHYGFNSFQHDNRVGVIGADGAMRHHDLGASHADMNTRLGHAVTREGNHLDYGQAMRGHEVSDLNNRRTTETARYGHEVDARGDVLSHQAAMTGHGIAADRLAFDKTQPQGQMSAYQAFQANLAQQKFDLEKGEKEAEEKRSKALSQRTIARQLDGINQLRTNPRLQEGFKEAFGKGFLGNNIIERRIPGTAPRDARAVLNRILGPEALRGLEAFKGPTSEKELAFIQGTASELSDPNISPQRAAKALDELEASLLRIQASGEGSGGVGGGNTLTEQELLELAELERQFGR